jgi:uncharacterized membrane protein HdeD (DUF308 family)
MKINYSFIRAIFALIIGLVLVCAPENSTKYIVITIGALFLVPGIIVLIGYFATQNNNTTASPEEGKAVVSSKRFPIEGIGSILLGLWFIISPTFFADLLVIVLSAILVIGGIQQLYALTVAHKWQKVHPAFYIVPLLVLGAGLYSLLNPDTVRNTILIIIGIACLVYASSELSNWFLFTRNNPQRQEQKQEQKAE